MQFFWTETFPIFSEEMKESHDCGFLSGALGLCAHFGARGRSFWVKVRARGRWVLVHHQVDFCPVVVHFRSFCG